MGDRGPPRKFGKHIPMLHDKVVQVSLLGWAEVLAHRNLRDLLSGRQRQGGRVRGFPSPSQLFQDVNVIDLGGLPPPRLSNPVVYFSHPFNHLIRSLPLGEEFALCRGDQDQDQLPRMEGSQLGSPVVDPRLDLLGLPEVFSDDGPHLGHVAPHLLYMVQGGAVG